MLQGEHVENASNAIPWGFSLGTRSIVLLLYTIPPQYRSPRRNANRSFHGEHVEKAIAETRAIQSGDFLWERESIVLHGEHVEKAIAETASNAIRGDFL